MRILVFAALIATAAVSCAFASPAPPASLFTTVYWNPDAAAPLNVSAFAFGVQPTTKWMQAARIAVNNNGMTAGGTGWDGVYVETMPQLVASINATWRQAAFYAAGFAEGVQTAGRIYQSWHNQNISGVRAALDSCTAAWVTEHVAYMRVQSELNFANDTYWAYVRLMLTQLEGLTDGYNEGDVNGQQLTFEDIFMLNFMFEIDDVAQACAWLAGATEPPRRLFSGYGQHCSAVVRVTDDGDVVMGHNTWASLESQLRQWKIYNFGFFIVEFSGYPGGIHSGDDYYTTSTDFVVWETTNANSNPATAPFVVPSSVSEFIRIRVALALATGGETFTELFCRANNGAYNNQYVLLDAGRLMLNNNRIIPDTMWVVEQMPNMCVRGDQSAVLNASRYWASYNRPFYSDVFNWSGFAKREATYGSLFSYGDNYRAQLFRRLAPLTQSLDDVATMLRYNNYKHDAESLAPNCSGAPGGVCTPPYSAELSIAARCDLVPANADFGVLTPFINRQDEAAIDAKLISVRAMATNGGSSMIINGPVFGGPSDIPRFNFSTFLWPTGTGGAVLRHLGIPDVPMFNWTTTDKIFDGAPPPPPFVTPTTRIVFQVAYQPASGHYVEENFIADVLSVVQPGNPVGAAANETTVVVQNAHNAGGLGAFEVVFTFSGPKSAIYANILLRTPAPELAAAGLSNLQYTTGDGGESGESLQKRWIIGVVIAGVAVLGIGLFTAARIRRNRRKAEGEYIPMNPS